MAFIAPFFRVPLVLLVPDVITCAPLVPSEWRPEWFNVSVALGVAPTDDNFVLIAGFAPRSRALVAFAAAAFAPGGLARADLDPLTFAVALADFLTVAPEPALADFATALTFLALEAALGLTALPTLAFLVAAALAASGLDFTVPEPDLPEPDLPEPDPARAFETRASAPAAAALRLFVAALYLPGTR